ncbi:MAG: hypothetical protein ABI425_00330 [Patescibacteria group bacterium]
MNETLPVERHNNEHGITFLERFRGAVERIDQNRLLLDTGEIIDNIGNLWGYRVYKGLPREDVDDTGKLKSSWSSRAEYLDALKERITTLEELGTNLVEDKWKFRNNMSLFEQLAVCQSGLSSSDNFAGSWTRDPIEAIGFAEWPSSNSGVVLQRDIPTGLCVSQEALKLREGAKNSSPYPLENRPEREKEISVFDFIDLTDSSIIKHDSAQLKRQVKVPRKKLRKTN